MRGVSFIFIVSFGLLYAQSYKEILKGVSKTPAIKSIELLAKASSQIYKSTKANEYPTIELNAFGSWLKETPKLILNTGFTPSSSFPMGKTRKFTAELKLSYPLFTGFAISAQIKKAKLNSKRAKLKVLDAKRNLFLKATELYGAIKSSNEAIKALKEAKRAMLLALKKAQGFYKNSLISSADLYNIKARVYDIETLLFEAVAKRKKLLNTLSYISAEHIEYLKGEITAPKIPPSKRLKEIAYKNRADIRALKILLEISSQDIALAKSEYYPKVAINASLKRQGDSLSLNGDGFTNANRSYLGLGVSYDIFDGGKREHTLEATRYKRLSRANALLDYKERVFSKIDNAYIELKALYSKLKSAKMRLKAQREYYRLTRAKFNNQLVSSDELSRSIADLANAKANKATIDNLIRVQKAKIWLLSGVESFEEKIGIR